MAQNKYRQGNLKTYKFINTIIHPAMEKMLDARQESTCGSRGVNTLAGGDSGMKGVQALSYISLFSGAGIGCYGFKLEGYDCIATNELLPKRLNIQRINNKCSAEDGYVDGDISGEATKEKILKLINRWLASHNSDTVDVVVATPPCQGMSVANHKRKNEMPRNSLVVESINIVSRVTPKFFVFENVRGFLRTQCVDNDGRQKPIRDAIDINLSGRYNILYRVVNFKNYGVPSSRTRTLVLGVRKDLRDVTPFDILPDAEKEVTLRDAIGHLPSLKTMGEVYQRDIFHNFRPYDPRMTGWIENLREGGSAFENSGEKRPHRLVDGRIVYNANKNGDKYSRWYFDRVGPCVHTRNDILASQATIHPSDNRVYSIRELMIMMSIPESFKWTEIPLEKLNAMPLEEKRNFLKKNEMNIRQSIGEAVPTLIFQKIARKIKGLLSYQFLNSRQAEKIIAGNNLEDPLRLSRFIGENSGRFRFPDLSRIAELANSKRKSHAAYYTRQDVCFTLVEGLPDFTKSSRIRILEPSVGAGNFVPLLIKKYAELKSVELDLVDIDAGAIEVLKSLIGTLTIPQNVKINYITGDFIFLDTAGRYDAVIGNPPFMRIKGNKNLLFAYKNSMHNKDTSNIASYFVEKSLRIGDTVALIAPKSIISAPEFNKTREVMLNGGMHVSKIVDFGESAFEVLIETVGIIMRKGGKDEMVKVESYITNQSIYSEADYLLGDMFPYWLIYRDDFFDRVCRKLSLGVFKVFRDRQITKKIMKSEGRYMVLRSKNLARDGSINHIPGYDKYVDGISCLGVSKYLNRENAVIAPNLSYYPRASFLPRNCIPDGSLAILTPKNPNLVITKQQLEYFSSDEFKNFYRIARNLGIRSLNIDSNSVYFWGLIKQ